jgi:hypothetical protein
MKANDINFLHAHLKASHAEGFSYILHFFLPPNKPPIITKAPDYQGLSEVGGGFEPP